MLFVGKGGDSDKKPLGVVEDDDETVERAA